MTLYSEEMEIDLDELKEFKPREPEGVESVDLRQCNVCEERLGLRSFPVRKGQTSGRVCTECYRATEALQRQMRATFGDQSYKQKWNELKKHCRSLWRQKILQLRDAARDEAEMGHLRQRRLKVELEQISSKHVRGKEGRRRRRRKMYTYPQVIEHFMSKAGGSYTQSQAADKWLELQRDKKRKADFKGVIIGESGKPRIMVSISSDELSDSVSGSYREHSKALKPKKSLADGLATERSLLAVTHLNCSLGFWEVTPKMPHKAPQTADVSPQSPLYLLIPSCLL